MKATVRWLECQAQCVPGKASLDATLQVAPEAKPSANAGRLEAAQGKLPKSADATTAAAAWEKPLKDNLRPLLLEWKSPMAAATVDFFPGPSDTFEVQPEVERVPADAGTLRVRKAVKKLSGDWPKEISGLLIQKTGDQQLAYEVTLPIQEGSTAAAVAVGEAPPVSESLWHILLYAFAGGLILNIMPCVLPVIALKILGFVGEARNDPRHVRKLGLLYALGVLVSCLALAGVVIALKAAGQKAGWGVQFSNGYFLIAMSALMTLIALNLFGVFEITLAGGAMNSAATLASKRGAAGAFFNGLLATLLATSCTAPFFGAALGFAFSPGVSNPIVMLVLLTVGAGLAAPYVVLSWEPAWLKFVPKPGAWMERFKMAMGFPMLATAVWLSSLATTRYGDRAWWLGIFLVFVGLAAWIYGEFGLSAPRKLRGLAAVLAVRLLVAGYSWAIVGGLMGANRGQAWQPWSPQTVAQLRGEGRPVLVDFTARWCLTCNTLVKPVLDSQSVREKRSNKSTPRRCSRITRISRRKSPMNSPAISAPASRSSWFFRKTNRLADCFARGGHDAGNGFGRARTRR